MADLEGRGFTLEKHDLAKERPSRELLSRLIDERGVDAVMNKRSPAFKERGLNTATITKQQALALIEEEPNLLKRPLLLTKSKTLLGYDAQEYASLK